MNDATKGTASGMRRILWLQAVLISGLAMAYAVLDGFAGTQAALYGGMIAVVGTLLQIWQLGRADQVAGVDLGRNMRFLYRSWMERLVLMVSLFAIGIVLVKLQTLPLIVGFITGQLAVVIHGLINR